MKIFNIILAIANWLQLTAYCIFLMMICEVVTFKFLENYTPTISLFPSWVFHIVAIFVFQMVYTKTYKFFDSAK
jgi:hypothetical protein